MKTNPTARMVACTLTAFLVLLVFSACGGKKTDAARVYANGSNTITLNQDFSFDAKLAHGVSKIGTYSETADSAGVITITYTVDGETAVGTIRNNVLTIPQEWEDSHGHGNTFTLQ